MLGELDAGALVGAAVRWQQVAVQRTLGSSYRHANGVAICSQLTSGKMLSPQSLLTMTGTADSAGAGVGAADEAKGEPVPLLSTTVEFWAASGSQHSAAQIAATSGTLAQCVSVASIAQISGLPILVPQLAPGSTKSSFRVPPPQVQQPTRGSCTAAPSAEA